MANRPQGYGMTAELQAKKDSNFDANSAEEARMWVEVVVGEPVDSWSTPAEIQDNLQDGTLLCKLINVIKPGSVKKINASKMAFEKMENIDNFLAGCRALTMESDKTDLFQTVDLYEGQNIPRFVNTIHALGRKCQKVRPDLPVLGPKEADKNKQEFTEEQLQTGKGVIGLQMGSNKGASQAGSTPYGLGRQIEKTNLKA